MSLTYSTYVTQLANLLVVSSADTNFNTQLPGIIDYAEQRIYREIDFLRTIATDATGSASSGVRDFNLSTAVGTFISVDGISIITPVTASASNGTRNQLTPVSREWMDAVYPSGQTITGVPAYFAIDDDLTVIFGPPPDAAYKVETYGEQRPAALSSGNSSTYLTQYIPDVFMAASMVYCCGYLKNFGSMTDDPRSAQAWESQYKLLMQSAQIEQLRAAFKSAAWTSQSPNPIATPPRA